MKPQVTYGGCDTRDVYYHGWDESTYITPPRDKERQYQIERAFLLDKTGRTADRIIKKSEGRSKTVSGVHTDTYTSPEKISRAKATKMRAGIEKENALFDELYA